MSDFIEDRKFVARLLMKVRLGELSVRQAMMNYPKDVKDETLIAAYHALIHYEADEDIRYHDIEYKEAQNDYLEEIAQTLCAGNELPRNIIADYEDYYKGTASLWKNGWQGFLKEFKRFINI